MAVVDPPINRNAKFRILWTTKGSMDPRLGTTAEVAQVGMSVTSLSRALSLVCAGAASERECRRAWHWVSWQVS